jgi:hypothetical protein
VPNRLGCVQGAARLRRSRPFHWRYDSPTLEGYELALRIQLVAHLGEHDCRSKTERGLEPPFSLALSLASVRFSLGTPERVAGIGGKFALASVTLLWPRLPVTQLLRHSHTTLDMDELTALRQQVEALQLQNTQLMVRLTAVTVLLLATLLPLVHLYVPWSSNGPGMSVVHDEGKALTTIEQGLLSQAVPCPQNAPAEEPQAQEGPFSVGVMVLGASGTCHKSWKRTIHAASLCPSIFPFGSSAI